MFNFIITVISEIVFSLNFARPIMFMAIIVCLFLLSSPGAIATILGGGAKLGILNYIREQQNQKNS